MSHRQARLVGQLHRQVGAPKAAELHAGVIVSAQTGPPLSVTLTLDGHPAHIAGVRYLASYTPAGGDLVIVAVLGSDSRNRQSLLVVGKLA